MQPTLTQRTPEELELFQAARNRYVKAIMRAADMDLEENEHDGRLDGPVLSQFRIRQRSTPSRVINM